MYALREAWRGLMYRRSMTLVSIVTITMALLISGAFSLVTIYSHTLLHTFMRSEVINVYLDNDLPDADMLALDTTITSMSEVEETEIVTSEDAARKLRELYKEDLLAGLEKNPLPRSIRVVMTAEHRNATDLQAVAERIRSADGVESVDYAEEWMEKVDMFFIIVLLVESTVGAIILGACTLIISNAVNMTIIARKDIIDIMRLVGATDGFIRRPFHIEGLIEGVLSGVAAFLILSGIALWVGRMFPDALLYAGLITGGEHPAISLNVLLAMLIPAGGALGFLGSAVAVRRSIT